MKPQNEYAKWFDYYCHLVDIKPKDTFNRTLELSTEDDFLQMMCEGFSIFRTDNNSNFSYTDMYKWWQEIKEEMNGAPIMITMVSIVLSDLANAEQGYSKYPNIFIKPENLLKSGYMQGVWDANVRDIY